ncbi:hypothetical protein Tco_0149586 [Tanacetum coccineum]
MSDNHRVRIRAQRRMIKVHSSIPRAVCREFEDNIVAVYGLKITGEGYYTCNIRVEYEWKPLSVGATKNLKKTSQTPKGIPVGQKMGFKPKQVFQPISKKYTANTCEKNKNNSESTKEMMDRKDLFETKAKGRSDGKAKEKILVLIPETTFVGVESRVLIPETTFVGVESRVLIPETTVWDTLVYPSDTLVILRAFAISPLGLRGSIRGYMKDLFETKAKGRSDEKAKEKILCSFIGGFGVDSATLSL